MALLDNQKAKESGFVNLGEQLEAKQAGISDSATWNAQRHRIRSEQEKLDREKVAREKVAENDWPKAKWRIDAADSMPKLFSKVISANWIHKERLEIKMLSDKTNWDVASNQLCLRLRGAGKPADVTVMLKIVNSNEDVITRTWCEGGPISN